MFLILIFTLSLFSCGGRSVESYVLDADALVAKGEIEDAIILYQKAIKKHGSDPVLYLNQAKLLRETKRYPMAIRNYQIIKERLDPKSFWPYIGLSRVYLDDGKNDQARQILIEGLDKFPDDPNILFQLGRVYYELGNGQLALKYLNMALDQNYKNQHKIYYYKGLTNEILLNDIDSAVLDYESYLLLKDADKKNEVQKKVTELKQQQQLN